MEGQHEVKKWINVVCADIDGNIMDITIARFNVLQAQDAIELALHMFEHNGSVHIEFEEF